MTGESVKGWGTAADAVERVKAKFNREYTVHWVLSLCRDKKIVCERKGWSYWIKLSSVEAYVRAQQAKREKAQKAHRERLPQYSREFRNRVRSMNVITSQVAKALLLEDGREAGETVVLAIIEVLRETFLEHGRVQISGVGTLEVLLDSTGIKHFSFRVSRVILSRLNQK